MEAYRWLFVRFVFRRLRLNPLRPLLLVAALAAASSLWGAVLRTTTAGIQTFEESLGFSEESFPFAISPLGGRISLRELHQCLVPIVAEHDLLALRREAGLLETSNGIRSVTIIGIARSGTQMAAMGGVGADTVFVSGESLRGAARISVGNASANVQLAGSLSSRVDVDGVSRVIAVPADAVVVSLEMLNQLVGDKMVDTFLLKPRGERVGELPVIELSRWLSSCWSGGVPLRVESSDQRVERGEALLGAYRMNVTILAAMTLLVCALVMSHAAHLSLLSITRELSVVRTLGIPRWWCAVAVVGESFVIGIVGALAGCTLGQALTLRIAGYLLETAEDIYAVALKAHSGAMVWRESLGVFITMVMVSVVGAVVACRAALRVVPSVGTRREHIQVRELSPRKAYVSGGVALFLLSGVTALLVVYPNLVWAYGAVGVGILWCLASVPALFAFLPHLLLRGGRNVSWRCARGGIMTFARGHLVGAMSAAVAIALMSAISLMVDSFRTTLEGWTQVRLRGDLYISSSWSGKGNEALLSEEVIERIRAVPGVQMVIPYREVTTERAGTPLVVGGTDLVSHARHGAYLFVDESIEPEVLGQPVEGRSRVLISESAVRKAGLSVGSSVEVGGRAFVIAGVIQEFSTEHPLVIMNERDFTEIFRNQQAQTLTVYLTPGHDRAQVQEVLRSLPGYSLQVRDQRELSSVVMRLFERTFRVTTSSRWIVFGVALLGLVISVWQLAWERRRELKVMQTLGMTRLQITNALALESLLVSCIPMVVGVSAGVYIGWVLTRYVNLLSFGWGLLFAVSWVPVITAVEFIAAFFGLVWCGMYCGIPWLMRVATVTDE